MTQIHDLAYLAKQAFDVSVAMDFRRPEGLAIQMKSGLILTGYSHSYFNAANDALRGLKQAYNNTQPRILDDFTVAAAVVFVAEKTRRAPAKDADQSVDVPPKFFKPVPLLIKALRRTLPVDDGATLYIASSYSTEPCVRIISTIPLSRELKA